MPIAALIGAGGALLGSIVGGLFSSKSSSTANNLNWQMLERQIEASEDAMALQQKYNLDLMAKEQDYNLSNMSTQQNYNLQTLAKQQEYNEANMASQFAYEKEMQQNKYQWAVQDLKNAGINPILAAGNLGSASSSVSSASPTGGSPSSQSIGGKSSSALGPGSGAAAREANIVASAAAMAEVVNKFFELQNSTQVSSAQSREMTSAAEYTDAQTEELRRFLDLLGPEIRLRGESASASKLESDIEVNKSLIDKSAAEVKEIQATVHSLTQQVIESEMRVKLLEEQVKSYPKESKARVELDEARKDLSIKEGQLRQAEKNQTEVQTTHISKQSALLDSDEIQARHMREIGRLEQELKTAQQEFNHAHAAGPKTRARRKVARLQNELKYHRSAMKENSKSLRGDTSSDITKKDVLGALGSILKVMPFKK